jgi:hypothetical protein
MINEILMLQLFSANLAVELAAFQSLPNYNPKII